MKTYLFTFVGGTEKTITTRHNIPQLLCQMKVGQSLFVEDEKWSWAINLSNLLFIDLINEETES